MQVLMNAEMEEKYCIVNADDFGASAGINRGIIEAHTEGILTSCSLMVNMAGTREAIAVAATTPNLSIGLHVNFTNETDPVIDINDTESARRELYRQYDYFVHNMGRQPTHIDSHHNVHREPNLEPLFIELADQHGLFLREQSPVRYYSNFYGQWDGESHPEHIGVDRLMAIFKTEIQPGFTELACHPGYPSNDFNSIYWEERQIELQSLCQPGVQRALNTENIKLTNYIELPQLLSINQTADEPL